MLGGSIIKVAAVLSCWKQKLTSASKGEVLHITIFSMFSGYLPSLYRSRVLPVKKDQLHFYCHKKLALKRNHAFMGPHYNNNNNNKNGREDNLSSSIFLRKKSEGSTEGEVQFIDRTRNCTTFYRMGY